MDTVIHVTYECSVHASVCSTYGGVYVWLPHSRTGAPPAPALTGPTDYRDLAQNIQLTYRTLAQPTQLVRAQSFDQCRASDMAPGREGREGRSDCVVGRRGRVRRRRAVAPAGDRAPENVDQGQNGGPVQNGRHGQNGRAALRRPPRPRVSHVV